MASKKTTPKAVAGNAASKAAAAASAPAEPVTKAPADQAQTDSAGDVVDAGQGDAGQVNDQVDSMATVDQAGTVEPGLASQTAPAAPVPTSSPKPQETTSSSTDAGARAYVVVSPLRRDRKAYGVGAPITLTTEQAAPLLGHTVTLPDTTDASEEAAAAGS